MDIQGMLIGGGLALAVGFGAGYKVCDNAHKAAQLEALEKREELVNTVEENTNTIEMETIKNEREINATENVVIKEVIKYRDNPDCPLSDQFVCVINRSLQDTQPPCDTDGGAAGTFTHQEALIAVTGNNIGHTVCLNRLQGLQAYVRALQLLEE